MNDYQKIFVEKINDAAKNSSTATVFNEFLTAATAALNRDEKTFKTVENQELHSDLLGTLAAAADWSISHKVLRDKKLGIDYRFKWLNDEMKPKYRDVLGEIFRELKLYEQDAGQVFTLQHTADISGELAFDETLIRNEIARQGFVTIMENCCGSGALVLGSLNALLEMNINPCHFAFVRAADIDERCIKMTFIQLSLYCIPAVIERRNAVTDEVFGEPLKTPMLIWHQRKNSLLWRNV